MLGDARGSLVDVLSRQCLACSVVVADTWWFISPNGVLADLIRHLMHVACDRDMDHS